MRQNDQNIDLSYTLLARRVVYQLTLSAESFSPLSGHLGSPHLFGSLRRGSLSITHAEASWEITQFSLDQLEGAQYAIIGRHRINHAALHTQLNALQMIKTPSHQLREGDLLLVGRGAEVDEMISQFGVWQIDYDEIDKLIPALNSLQERLARSRWTIIDQLARAYLCPPQDEAFPLPLSPPTSLDEYEALLSVGSLLLLGASLDHASQSRLTLHKAGLGAFRLQTSLAQLREVDSLVILWDPSRREPSSTYFHLPYQIMLPLVSLLRAGWFSQVFAVTPEWTDERDNARWQDQYQRWRSLGGSPIHRFGVSPSSWERCSRGRDLPRSLLEQVSSGYRPRPILSTSPLEWRATPSLQLPLNALSHSTPLFTRLGLIPTEVSSKNNLSISNAWVSASPLTHQQLSLLCSRYPRITGLLTSLCPLPEPNNEQDPLLINGAQAVLICDVVNLVLGLPCTYLDEPDLEASLKTGRDALNITLRLRSNAQPLGLRLPSLLEREAWTLPCDATREQRSDTGPSLSGQSPRALENQKRKKTTKSLTCLTLAEWGLYITPSPREWTHDDPFIGQDPLELIEGASPLPFNPFWSSILPKRGRAQLGEIRPIIWSSQQERWLAPAQHAHVRFVRTERVTY